MSFIFIVRCLLSAKVMLLVRFSKFLIPIVFVCYGLFFQDAYFVCLCDQNEPTVLGTTLNSYTRPSEEEEEEEEEEACWGGCGVEGCSGKIPRHPCSQSHCKKYSLKFTCVDMQRRLKRGDVKINRVCPKHLASRRKYINQPDKKEANRIYMRENKAPNNPINIAIYREIDR